MCGASVNRGHPWLQTIVLINPLIATRPKRHKNGDVPARLRCVPESVVAIGDTPYWSPSGNRGNRIECVAW